MEDAVKEANTNIEGATPAAEADATEEKKDGKKPIKVKRGKKKTIKQVTIGNAYIKATYNNTIITITDQVGNAISFSSAGLMGFKGAKKATPYAATVIVRDAVDKAKVTGIRDVNVFVRGVGSGREAAIRALISQGLEIDLIKDLTPIPHNGCRPPKVRRV